MLIHEQQAAVRPRAARTTLLGRPIEAPARLRPAIDRANARFALLGDAERAEVTASIATLTCTGHALDVNAGPDPSDAALELFLHVAGSAFDARDPQQWLEAGARFRFHFPLFLSRLLDEAQGGDSHTVLAEWAEAFDWISQTTTLVGQAMVASLGVAELTAAARLATRAETAAWLDRIAAEWDQVRAWIDGVSGPLPLHPSLVETLAAAGWAWRPFTRFVA